MIKKYSSLLLRCEYSVQLVHASEHRYSHKAFKELVMEKVEAQQKRYNSSILVLAETALRGGMWLLLPFHPRAGKSLLCWMTQHNHWACRLHIQFYVLTVLWCSKYVQGTEGKPMRK